MSAAPTVLKGHGIASLRPVRDSSHKLRNHRYTTTRISLSVGFAFRPAPDAIRHAALAALHATDENAITDTAQRLESAMNAATTTLPSYRCPTGIDHE